MPDNIGRAQDGSGSRLVIVESPAKAKTIAGYLGDGYDVQSSIGHIRDLPNNASEIPAAQKGVTFDNEVQGLPTVYGSDMEIRRLLNVGDRVGDLVQPRTMALQERANRGVRA